VGLAHRIADLFSAFPSVEAIALAGSRAAGTVDQDADIDLYFHILAKSSC
jgi:hypothetical protein